MNIDENVQKVIKLLLRKWKLGFIPPNSPP